MRKLLVPLILASVCLMISFASGCGGGDTNPKVVDAKPKQVEKMKPADVGAKPE